MSDDSEDVAQLPGGQCLNVDTHGHESPKLPQATTFVCVSVW